MRTSCLSLVLAALLLVGAAAPAGANGLGSDREHRSRDRDLDLDDRHHDHSPSFLDARGDHEGWDEDRDHRGDDDWNDDRDDHDWHFGDGWHHDGKDDCKPIPEPGTVLLLALGLTGLARARRFRSA